MVASGSIPRLLDALSFSRPMAAGGKVNASDDHESGRTEVIELISRYFAAVDDKRLQRAIVEATFAPDGKIVRPNGAELVGPKAITEGQSESFARFRATHHVVTDHV